MAALDRRDLDAGLSIVRMDIVRRMDQAATMLRDGGSSLCMPGNEAPFELLRDG